jgi:XTP/dITP diphosphohydrolase
MQNLSCTEDERRFASVQNLIQPPVTALYAATSNAGKLREFAQAAAPAGVSVLPLPHLAHISPPEEDAPTFTGNADLKAIYYSNQAPDLLVFADDSGLEVPALGNRPGVLSARFADSLSFESPQGGSSGIPGFSAVQQQSKDQRNNRALLSLLHDLERTNAGHSGSLSPGYPTRAARFVCSLSLARNGQILLRADGTVEGEVIDTPRGTNGFGYDPLFVLPRRGLTLAELSTEDKWAISHRGQAFRNLLAQLQRTSF